MSFNDLDPSRIRKCELFEQNSYDMVQFIAISDKHKMIRNDDGEITVTLLPEQGNEYRYGDPVRADIAIQILEQNTHESHQNIAQQIKDYLSNA